MAAVVAAHLFEPPPRVTESVPTLPAAIDAVVAKAMAKDPDRRYQSARELAEAATDALDDVVPAPSPRPMTGSGPAVHRRPTPADRSPPNSVPPSPFPRTRVTAAPGPPPALISPPTTRRRVPSRRAIVGAAVLVVVGRAA